MIEFGPSGLSESKLAEQFQDCIVYSSHNLLSIFFISLGRLTLVFIIILVMADNYSKGHFFYIVVFKEPKL